MNLRIRSLLGTLVGIALIVVLFVHTARTQSNAHPKIATDADFRQTMQELSNWGRWGEKDELGAANLITPAKRKQALALAKDGTTISLAHDVIPEGAVDAPTILERTVINVGSSRALDSSQSTGS